MKAFMRWLAAVVLSCVAVPVAAQRGWVAEWLKDFAGDRRATVIARMNTIDSLKILETDLDQLSDNIPATLGLPADQARRVAAAFATEAVFAKFEQSQSAVKLIEWSCRQIRRVQRPTAADQLWHLTAFSLLSGTADPDAIEAHVAHMRLQFPKEPRLLLERAVAAELRASRFGNTRGAAPADAAKKLEEAARRYTDAAAVEAIRGEALLRLARVELERDRVDAALAALAQAEPLLTERDLVYLARLFRGLALERQGKTADARAAYEGALAARPETQSASVALASLLFRTTDRDRANTIVSDVLGRERQPNDPWWVYPPGDFRLVDSRMAALRQAVGR